MVLEGVDFSAGGPPSPGSLKAAGKHFAGRYAVNDKTPSGRGITAAEYKMYIAAGIDIFLYWESSEGWMTGGYDAGVAAAKNAQANILAAGIPADAPVYFACDFDAAPSDQAAIDDCLRGAASVVGFERTGLYAGYHVLLRSKQNKTARWFCQTLAWSGGNLMPGVHLYQYGFDVYIDGVNVDLVRAYYDDYGQTVRPKPAYPTPRPVPAAVLQGHDAKDKKGNDWYAVRRKVNVKPGTKFYVNASTRSKECRPAATQAETVEIVGRVNAWYLMADGASFQIKDASVAVSFKENQ